MPWLPVPCSVFWTPSNICRPPDKKMSIIYGTPYTFFVYRVNRAFGIRFILAPVSQFYKALAYIFCAGLITTYDAISIASNCSHGIGLLNK